MAIIIEGLVLLTVSPSRREIRVGEQRMGLEPRVMQVLVVLGRAAGSVVPRDELVARCWGDVVVGEDALNRTLGKLRRLPWGDTGAPFEIARHLALAGVPRALWEPLATLPPGRTPQQRRDAFEDAMGRLRQALAAPTWPPG
jgi:hypothetical protein